MPDLKIEFELIPVPLPKEKEEAYWQAIRVKVELISPTCERDESQ